MQRQPAKIFGIGFHKTGSTSLAVALEQLGYRVTGPNGVQDPDIEHNVRAMVHSLVDEYDAFQDNPWPIVFEELDERYPRSKFILTVRDPGSWIRSQVRHFGTNETPMRRWIYGVGAPKGNEDVYVARYNKHVQDVLAHFTGRPDDLLVIDIVSGDGWEGLCGFLSKDVPDKPFPHANKARSSSS